MKSASALFSLLIFLVGLILTSCGTTTGNSSVALQSESFNVTGNTVALTAKLATGYFETLAPPTTNVSDFRLCAAKITLKDINGTSKMVDDDEEISMRLGLINLTSGEEKTWGSVMIPVNFMVTRVIIKAKQDTTLCGSDFPYSVKFNNVTTTDDVQFNFLFDPPVNLAAADTLRLTLSQLVGQLRRLSDSGNLNNGTIKNKIEQQANSIKKKNF